MNRIFQYLATSHRLSTGVVLLLASFLFAGCFTDPNPSDPFVFPGQETGSFTVPPADQDLGNAATAGTNYAFTSPTTAELRPGETVTVAFSDLPAEHALRTLEVRIGEDGKITLYHNITVVAAGKTTTQLQEDIRDAYVPRLFKQLTVTVKGAELFYYVGGEVKQPNKQYYLPNITVLRAIDTANGFTEYANKRKIELTRSTGEKFIIDGKKALKKPELDMEVLPNDRIYVPRRGW